MSDDDTGKPHPSAYAKALGMLARREQSRRELERKLGRQGFERDESESALDRLAGQHYQDDGRFAGMLAREVSPRSLREMKREVWNAQFQTLGQAIDAANADMAASFVSEDFKEGVAHYLEKRAPAFTGR